MRLGAIQSQLQYVYLIILIIHLFIENKIVKLDDLFETLLKKDNKLNRNSNRRRTKDSARERKKNELPPVLMPKFPSQRLVRKKKSNDKIDQKWTDREDEEGIPQCPTDKFLEDEEELGAEQWNVDRCQEPEEEEDNLKQPVPEKPSLVLEKPIRPEKSQANQKGKENRSARSEHRKRGTESDRNKKVDTKRRISKRSSAENIFSEEGGGGGRQSLRKSRKVTTKKVQIKTNNNNVVKSIQQPTPSQDPPNISSSPDNKPDRLINNCGGPEKSTDEKVRKPPVPPTPPVVPPTPPTTGTPIAQTPPLQVSITMKRDQGSAGMKPKTASSAQTSQRFDTQKKKRKNGFLKSVYRKTKFWGRKSDCVADPTIEMLAKSYVPPEYDKRNELDFRPDIKKWFSSYPVNDYVTRVKTNLATSKDDIFVNNRPFWLTRQPGDESIPKVRIQLHKPLKQMYLKCPTEILPKQNRQIPFNDPKTQNWKLLKMVDKSIGIEDDDTARVPEKDQAAKDKAKENELKRVTANTFHATMMFEVEKLIWDEQQKKKDPDPKRRQLKKDVEPKSSLEDEPPSGKRVTWSFPQKPAVEKVQKLLKKPDISIVPECVYEYQLQTYNRKLRPHPDKFKNRDFATFDYIVGISKIPRKATAIPASSSSATSVSSKSVTKSSSTEGKK
ncbi:hypothetical protein L5515_013024 [Caenorhabditis briggsae]|uniref:Uncharacterized protein n=1 Tax=Caenorhabditis briggsae TaxID=6238 RepID=A0AAE9E6Y6_CAEBR|nr:hypothetical protein L5515_013024 [Caenorhabditis briggsae]